MEAFLTGISLKDIGAVTLVVIAVLMFYFGKIVPRSTVDSIVEQYAGRLEEARADRDARLAEARTEINDWKAAHETSEHARELLAHQVRELAELGRTVDHVMRSLQAATGIGAGAEAAGHAPTQH